MIFLFLPVVVRGGDPDFSGTAPVKLGSLSAEAEFEALVATGEFDSHPLLPTLRIAYEGYQRMQTEIRDYTCVMLKRERVGGKVYGPERIFAKVRHAQLQDDKVVVPFGIYLKFQLPASMRNREVLFVQDDNRFVDKVLVKKGGKRLSFLTFTLDAHSPMAMTGNRYPITEFGLKRLIERMILFGNLELNNKDCQVTTTNSVDVAGRMCTCVEVKPKPRPDFQYTLARIFIDDELRVPIRFESFGWEDKESETPVMLEEYTYHDLKLNVGLTEADFQRDNPKYGFR